MRKRPIIQQRWAGFPIHTYFSNRRGKRHTTVMRKRLMLLVPGVCALSMVLFYFLLEALGDESITSTPAPIVRPEETNSQEMIEAILQIQGQLRSNQLAIEQDEKQAKEAAARNAEVVSNGLQRIEIAFSTQQEDFSARSVRELEIMQSSNRSILIVAGTIASIAFLTMLITGYFQWRASKVWAEISTASTARGGRGSPVAALGISSQPVLSSGPVEDANLRFLRALEQLEKRIQHLEQSSRPTLRIHAPASLSGKDEGLPAASMSSTTAVVSDESKAGQDAQIPALLKHGQSRLKENDLEAALRYFDQALSLKPNHPEALVKKGAILERLKRLSEASECYDLAIAADDTMTSAYLHKGSLYNRLGHFKEALECYEKALQAQEE
jgi:tetratricopeptide (TPR) repeat protein